MRLYAILAPGRADLYWRPNRCGYTTNLADIGIYSEEESKGIENLGRGDKRVPLSHLVGAIVELRARNRDDVNKLTMIIRQAQGLKGRKDA